MTKPRKKFQLIATTFDKKGRVVGAGVNDSKKSHPLMALYSEKVNESSYKIYKHAECSALISAGNKDVYSVLVQRFNKDGTMALAKPCKICDTMLKDYGVKIVRYTTPDGIKEYTNE